MTASVTDSAASLQSLTTAATDAITVTVNDAATIAQFNAIDLVTGSNVVLTGGLTDAVANLVSGGAATAGLTAATTQDADVAITVTDAVTIAELAVIDALTTGTLTYTTIADTAANLATNSGGYVSGTVAVTVNDAATIAQLTSIDNFTSGTVTYTSMTDTVSNLTTNTGNYVNDTIDPNVAVSDAASISQLAAIDTANGTGTVTATSVTDAAATLVTNSGGYLNTTADPNVTINDAATVAQYNTINGYTDGTITFSISDTVANLTGEVVSGATSVTAVVQSGDTDLTNDTLDGNVDTIDLGSLSTTLSVAQAQLSLTNAGASTTVQLNSGGGDANLYGVTFDTDVTAIDINSQNATLDTTQIGKTLSNIGSVKLQLDGTGYSGGSNIAVTKVDTIDIDDGTEITALSAPVAASLDDVDTAGEWYFSNAIDLLIYHNGSTAISMTLSGASSVTSDGDDTFTVA
ncbi:MAG: hypothetical protein HQL82_16235 [Magnetococcales bacterium]|nr:hypothetical protein [Magnetococcales bacterium]